MTKIAFIRCLFFLCLTKHITCLRCPGQNLLNVTASLSHIHPSLAYVCFYPDAIVEPITSADQVLIRECDDQVGNFVVFRESFLGVALTFEYAKSVVVRGFQVTNSGGGASMDRYPHVMARTLCLLTTDLNIFMNVERKSESSKNTTFYRKYQ